MSIADGLKTPKHNSQTTIKPDLDTKGSGVVKPSVGVNPMAAKNSRPKKRRLSY